jgi:hypothetical protein
MSHLASCVAVLSVFFASLASGMTPSAARALRGETRDIFYHGYDNYLRFAFPEDELRPVTCGPLTRDRENEAHVELNDVLGNYSLTLIDSLSTLAIIASSPAEDDEARSRNESLLAGRGSEENKPLRDFQDGVQLLVEYYGDGTDGASGQGKRARGFDLDSKVQVFETVIRGVGGLLSAHLFSVGELPIRGYVPKEQARGRHGTGIHWRNGLVYDGQLLRLAKDLAERLLPAFYTPTDLPYPRVNLRTGVPFYLNSPYNTDAEYGECPVSQPENQEITETCSAGAGSLVLEFSTLSRLTGDERFERLAKEAFWAVWKRRSSTGLIGAGIDAESGQWVTAYTGIGAGIDSFFEYAFKSHILLSGLPFDESRPDVHSPDAFLDAWQEAHAAIKRHVYRGEMFQHPHYIQSDVYTGASRAFWIDSLSAYFPGLLTLSGELDEAIATHLLYTALWTRYSALPERWSTVTGTIESGLRWWGGRPEFIESTWYLYRATKDPWYLHTGEMALRDIKRRCWTKCGWAGLQDVRSGEQSDRMESFFLGETAKYLFLLFDQEHPLNSLDKSWVFTTEGHPLIIPKKFARGGVEPTTPMPIPNESITDSLTKIMPTCPSPPSMLPLSISATAARGDIFHAASLARIHLMPSIETAESPLVEFAAEHPSVSFADLQSPSNYTFYPWTLPLSLVPTNGICTKMSTSLTFDLTFPNFPENPTSLSALQRVYDGLMVNSMSGVRLGMVKEPVVSTERKYGDNFRIYSVSNVALGRDEKVFLSRESVETFSPVDPFFTRVRDLSLLHLMLDVAPESQPLSNTTTSPSKGKDEAPDIRTPTAGVKYISLDSDEDIAEDPSLFSSFLNNIHSILLDALPSTPKSNRAPPPLVRHILTASLPSGPGAAPLASLDFEPLNLPHYATQTTLDWRSVYFVDGDLCEATLPASVPREHQVIVVRRGGCSFSRKMQGVPAFPPDTGALQLVLVVSFPEHDRFEPYDDDVTAETPPSSRKTKHPTPPDQDADMRPPIQPYLDTSQLTPAGVPRPHPIPMVMIGGGDRAMALLRRAKGVGVRRRWWFESQGVRIGNLIVV